MSFICSVYIPEAIVMASDSRQSVSITTKDKEGKDNPPIQTTSSDSVNKTFLLEGQGVGISFAGDTLLGGITTESHIKRFLEEKVVKTDDVETIADKIFDYFKTNFPNANTNIHVCGFKKEGKASIPYAYGIHIAKGERQRKNVKSNNKKEIDYGVMWSGEGDIIARLLIAPLPKPDGTGESIPPVPVMYPAMSPQDAVDFAIYLTRTTAETMRFQARPKTVGGPVDVLLLTPDGSRWIQKKEIVGQNGNK